MISQPLSGEPAPDGLLNRRTRPTFDPPAKPSPGPVQPGPQPQPIPDAPHVARPTLRVLAVATTLLLAAVYTVGGLRVGILGPSEPGPASATAREAVRGFLEALIAGDATAALSYAATAPADLRMLTDDVLAKSLATNPMGGIQVLEGTGSRNHESVHVLYRMGDRQVNATFDAVRLGDKWLLQSVSSRAHLTRINARALGLQLNGVVLPTDTPELFIGTYTMTTSDYRLSITGSTFFVESFRTNPNTAEISVELSDEGVGAIRDSAHSKLTDCVKEKKLAPSGCGFSATPTAGNPRQNTITWQITSGTDELKSMKVALSTDDPSTARGAVDITLSTTYSIPDGSVQRASSAISEVYVNLQTSSTDITFISSDRGR